MKTNHAIEVRAGDLKSALIGLGKVVPRKPSLKLLGSIRVEVGSQSNMRLTGSDGSFHLELSVPCISDGKVEPFLVPLATLREQIKGHKVGDVFRLKLPSSQPVPGEFPDPVAFRAAPIPLPPRIQTSLLRAFACASQDEPRYILRGAFLDLSGQGKNGHRIVATNGRQLFSSNSMQFPKLKESVILPDHPLWGWKAVAESEGWTLRVGASKSGATPFRVDGPFWRFSGNCLEGNYPNYRQVIPPDSQFKTRIEMPQSVSEAIADLIPKLPGKQMANKPIGIHAEKGLVSLLARESEKEPWQFYPIGKSSMKGSSKVTFANRDYIQRAARFGLGTVSLTDDQSPIQFSSGGDLMIVMPVRANGYENLKRPGNVKPIVVSDAPSKTPKRRSKPEARPAGKARSTRKASSTEDPIHEVESRIAKANEALASVGKQLESANGSLKAVRKQHEEAETELKGFRSLFRSIKNLATGSN